MNNPQQQLPIKDILKHGYWILSIALAVYIAVELHGQRQQQLILHNDKIAYEAATQNVTRELIGYLRGKGENNLAEAFKTWATQVKLEQEKQKKELGKEF